MIAALLAAATVAAAPAPAKAAAPAPKEPSISELKAENTQLRAQVTYFQGVAIALKAQREQASDQAADVSARAQAQNASARQ